MHAGLAVAADNLAHGRLDFLGTSVELPTGMTTLGEMFRVGPTHDLIGHLHGGDGRGAFELFPVTGTADAIGNDRSLWAAYSKARRYRRRTRACMSSAASSPRKASMGMSL